MYVEICANCAHWIICKAEGALPNDYCGLYQSEQTTDEQEEMSDGMEQD